MALKTQDILKQAPKLRKLGIKIIGKIALWETAENIMRISETADLRAKFAASVMDVMEQLQLDGFYFQWMWPGCPRVCHHNYKSLIILQIFMAAQVHPVSPGRVQ
jgi:GH18 family chitinase